MISVIGWILRRLLVIAPCALLAAWGFAYLKLCYFYLLNPHRPVEFSYKAAAGVVHVRAASYFVDAKRGVITIRSLTVKTPAGRVVASTNLIVVSNLNPAYGAAQNPLIDIYRVSGTLVRYANGQFELAGLLPSQQKSTNASPYRVRVHEADVEVVDLQGRPWRQRLRSRFVEVSGAGSDWIAHAKTNLPGMGDVDLGLQSVADLGIQASGTTRGVDATGLVAHVVSDRKIPLPAPLRSLRFSRIYAAGPFQVFLPQKKGLTFHTEATVSIQNAAYQQYRVEQIDFSGQIGGAGLEGKAHLALSGCRAQFAGSLDWQGAPTAGGLFTVKCAGPSALPQVARKYVPAGTSFSNVSANGWLSYRHGKEPYAQAVVTASRVSYRGQSGSDVRANLFADPRSVRLDLLHVNVSNASPTGSGLYDLRKKTITAFSQGTNLNLADVGKLTHTTGLSGTGSAQAIITGSVQKPDVQFQASALGSFRKGKYKLGPDRLEVAGEYRQNMILVRRGYLSGLDGLLAISGSSSPTGDKLEMNVEARNLQPGRYVAAADGVVSVSAKVAGNYLHPVARGVVRGVDLSYKNQDVPAAVAQFIVDRDRVVASNIRAISGTAQLQGGASYGFHRGDLAGKLSVDGVELAQYMGTKAAGIINLPTVQLSGTARNPVAVARVEGNNLIFGDLVIESVEALARATKDEATVDHATASLAGGTISALGSYQFGKKTGSAVMTSTAMDISKLAPFLGTSVTIKGNASVTEAKVAYNNGAIDGMANGKLENVTANGAAVGDGNWTLGANGDVVKGEVSIGQVLPELRVVDAEASYNLKSKIVSGSFDADRARLRDILSASLRYLPSTWAANSESLLSASGDLTVGATFNGPFNSPDLNVNMFSVANLKYKGQDYGELSAQKVQRVNQLWTAPEIKLAGPEGTVAVTGKLEEHGDMDLTATGSGIQARAFAPFYQNLLGSTAVTSFSAHATGPTSGPEIAGTLDAQHLVAAPEKDGKPQLPLDLHVALDKVSLTKGQLGMQGTFQYDGFTGSLFGTTPFSYKNGFKEGSLQAHLVLDKRAISDIPFFTSLIDPARTVGTVSGDIAASGPLNELAFSGGVDVLADTLGIRFTTPGAYIKRVDDELRKVAVKVSITKDKQLALTGSADSSRGGSTTLDVRGPLPDFAAFVNGTGGPVADAILGTPITGSFKLDNLAFRQAAPGGFVAGLINGATPLMGTLGQPAIGTKDKPGTFTLSHVDTTLPTFPGSSGGSSAVSINPSFYLSAALADPAHVKSATANLNLTGDATLRGSLSDPRARASLVVASGSVRLPGGTVRLDQGGTIDIGYRSNFAQDAAATVNVDLEGHTSITAIRYGQNTQRYNITVDITGDALQDNGLHFSAISDPPDLSSDDVLALLGQKTLLESLSTAGQNEAERRVRDALVGFALPSLLDPYTSSLAHSLGLDYLSLEYNSRDLATVDVARALSPDLSLQYRQQVGTPPPGYRAIYDFRVVYSPHRVPGILKRFSLSAGFDQDRPWKVALEYGTRFGGYTGPMLRNKTVLSSPSKP